MQRQEKREENRFIMRNAQMVLLVRNVLCVHQCSELVLHQWKSSQGQSPNLLFFLYFCNHHRLSQKHSVRFTHRDRELYLESTSCCFSDRSFTTPRVAEKFTSLCLQTHCESE